MENALNIYKRAFYFLTKDPAATLKAFLLIIILYAILALFPDFEQNLVRNPYSQ